MCVRLRAGLSVDILGSPRLVSSAPGDASSASVRRRARIHGARRSTCHRRHRRPRRPRSGAVPLYKVNVKAAHTRLPERRVPELIPVLGSQPAGDVSHKSGGRLPLLSARPAVTPATFKRAATNFAACLVNRGTMGVNSLPKTVTRQRRGCDLNPGHTAAESSTLTTRLPSHPHRYIP